MNKYNKDELNIVAVEMCYVVLRNDIRINPKTKKRDDFTKVLWVFKNEEEANVYVKGLRAKTPSLMTSFYVIPTPYGTAKEEGE